MTDILVDDPTLGHLGADVRIYEEWTGTDVEIPEMSVVVRNAINRMNYLNCEFFFLLSHLGLHSRCQTAKISSTFSRSLSSQTFP